MMTDINPVVLFVDDEDQSRKYFKKAFSKEFSVLTADSVQAAKSILNDQGDAIGVLVTDQRMPAENGVVLLDYTRQSFPHIIRLLTTGYSDLSDAVAAVNSGEIIRYIEKPWNLDSLRMELRSALRYYQLQVERDQLIREKLHVKQRTAQAHLVRDLMLIGESFSHLRNSGLGTRSMLLQASISSGLDGDGSHHEMWNLFEETLNRSMDLAKTIRKETQGANASDFRTASIKALIESALKVESPTVAYEFIEQSPLPDLSVDVGQIHHIVRLIVRLLQPKDSSETVNLKVSANIQTDRVVLKFKPQKLLSATTHRFQVNADLMALFLFAAHQNGDITLHHGDDYGLDLSLPLEGQSVLAEELAATSFEEIIALYES